MRLSFSSFSETFETIEQLLKCVKMIFSQNWYIWKLAGKTQTRKGTAISIFSEYFIYLLYLHQRTFRENFG